MVQPDPDRQDVCFDLRLSVYKGCPSGPTTVSYILDLWLTILFEEQDQLSSGHKNKRYTLQKSVGFRFLNGFW